MVAKVLELCQDGERIKRLRQRMREFCQLRQFSTFLNLEIV